MKKKRESSDGRIIVAITDLDLRPTPREQEKQRRIFAWEKSSNEKYFVLGEPSRDGYRPGSPYRGY